MGQLDIQWKEEHDWFGFSAWRCHVSRDFRLRTLLYSFLFALLSTALVRADSITFTFTLPQPGGGTANAFDFYAYTGSGFQGATASLYDGSVLLGTSVDTSNSVMDFTWVSPSSPFTVGPPTVINFASFIDGTIQGRIVV